MSTRKLELAVAWLAVAVGWCAAVLGLVVPRLCGADPGPSGPVGFASEMVVAMWFPGGLLAAFVALVTVLRRMWLPAAALAPVVLVTLVPELWAWSRASGERISVDDTALRVAAVNLNEDNVDDPLMEAAVRALGADVLILSEFTSSWEQRLERWFRGDYAHRWRGAPPAEPGLWLQGQRLAVWSRLAPVGEPEVRLFSGRAAQIRVPLRYRGRDFALFGIHPSKPHPYRNNYFRSWDHRREILDWVRSERLPVVVAGDFNATPGSAFLRRLRGAGLSNASEVACGYAPVTWDMSPGYLAPFRIAIDHVMHGAEFAAVGFARGAPTNSDHAAVVAALRWQAH